MLPPSKSANDLKLNAAKAMSMQNSKVNAPTLMVPELCESEGAKTLFAEAVKIKLQQGTAAEDIKLKVPVGLESQNKIETTKNAHAISIMALELQPRFWHVCKTLHVTQSLMRQAWKNLSRKISHMHSLVWLLITTSTLWVKSGKTLRPSRHLATKSSMRVWLCHLYSNDISAIYETAISKEWTVKMEQHTMQPFQTSVQLN